MSVITPPGQAPEQQSVPESPPKDSYLKRLASLQSIWILGVLVVIVVLFTLAAGSKFLSTSNFSLISQNISVWAVLGVGMTFVIITAGIDLSIGSVLVFASVVAAKVMEAIGGDGWGVAAIGIAAALVSGIAWGLLNGFLIAKAKIPPLIVTLGALSVALGLAQVITGGVDIRSVPAALTDFSTYIKILGIPALPFVALVTVIIGGIVLHKTRFGRYTFAIGSNELSARRVGINVDRHLIIVYGISGAMAGLGAVLALAQFGTTTIAGQSLTNLNVIAAVVIGGTSIFGGIGGYAGTILGALILTLLDSLLTILNASQAVRQILYGLIVLVLAAIYARTAGAAE
jgi:ribose transport system permease protein